MLRLPNKATQATVPPLPNTRPSKQRRCFRATPSSVNSKRCAQRLQWQVPTIPDRRPPPKEKSCIAAVRGFAANPALVRNRCRNISQLRVASGKPVEFYCFCEYLMQALQRERRRKTVQTGEAMARGKPQTAIHGGLAILRLEETVSRTPEPVLPVAYARCDDSACAGSRRPDNAQVQVFGRRHLHRRRRLAPDGPAWGHGCPAMRCFARRNEIPGLTRGLSASLSGTPAKYEAGTRLAECRMTTVWNS